MHYCQVCDEPRLMAPEQGVARCPTCGSVDPVALAGPLFVVTGASGSGKSTLFRLLLDRLPGKCAVFDVDWLIDPLGRSTPDGQVDWPTFRDSWLHVAHGVTQNGLVPVLLGPFFPAQLDALPGRAWIGDVHFLVLDCPDDERRQRIEARPLWRRRDTAEQIDFARWLRTNLAPVIDTSVASPGEAADAVAAWVRDATTGAGGSGPR